MDLNHRPLGYEGNSVRHTILDRTARYNETLEDLPLFLLLFALFWPPFTDRKRTAAPDSTPFSPELPSEL